MYSKNEYCFMKLLVVYVNVYMRVYLCMCVCVQGCNINHICYCVS